MRRLDLPLLILACAVPGNAQSPVRTASPFGEVELVHGELPDDVAWTLWIAYGQNEPVVAEDRQYLNDLQSRFDDQGVRLAVVLPGDAAAVLAGEQRAFTIAARPLALVESPHVVLVKAKDVEPVVQWHTTLDGAVDVIRAAVAGRLDARAVTLALNETLGRLLRDVGDGDGGAAAEEVGRLAELLPISGRARALAVLYEWWCKGELVRGLSMAEQATRDLADEYVPLALFADLVLRGGQDQPELARLLAVSLAPAVATASGGAFTQLVYLRALLLAGQDRLAGRYAATLPKLVQDRPLQQLILAETLMEAGEPAVYRDAAERALEACKGQVDPRWWDAARHKILVRTAAPQAEIDALLEAYRQTDGHSNHGLNNDAWYLMIETSTMGRFDCMAMANAEEMLREQQGAMSFGNKDTVALAMFRNGELERAVELQEEAILASGGQPDYAARLARFKSALQRRRSDSSDGKSPK